MHAVRMRAGAHSLLLFIKCYLKNDISLVITYIISNFAVSKYNGRTVHIKNTIQNMNYNNKNEYG